MQAQDLFTSDIRALILQSRAEAVRAVDHTRVKMYWQIGRRIFEEEQSGKDRADYGTFLIRRLAEALQPEFGRGFSVRQLERFRQFYRAFPITSALRTQFSWTHYKQFLSLENDSKREFYILEAPRSAADVRELFRPFRKTGF